MGQGDKKVVGWDTRANEVIQEYDDHLGLFIDEFIRQPLRYLMAAAPLRHIVYRQLCVSFLFRTCKQHLVH